MSEGLRVGKMVNTLRNPWTLKLSSQKILGPGAEFSKTATEPVVNPLVAVTWEVQGS